MKAGLGAAANGPGRRAGQQPVGMAAVTRTRGKAPARSPGAGRGVAVPALPWGGADSSALLHADALGGLAKERHGVGLELEGG
jgi:hypothetical protein